MVVGSTPGANSGQSSVGDASGSIDCERPASWKTALFFFFFCKGVANARAGASVGVQDLVEGVNALSVVARPALEDITDRSMVMHLPRQARCRTV